MQSLRCLVIGMMSALKRDTARGHHRFFDPAEADNLEDNWPQGGGNGTVKARAKSKVGESILKRPLLFKKSTAVVQKRDHVTCTFHLAAKSLAGAQPAAMLAQACEKRGRKAGDDHTVGGCGREIPFSRNRRKGDHSQSSSCEFL